MNDPDIHRHEQNCKYKQQLDRQNDKNITFSYLEALYIKCSNPACFQRAPGCTAKLSRKIGISGESFSVITQVKYIFTHCPPPPALQTGEGAAGEKCEWTHQGNLQSLKSQTPREQLCSRETGQPNVKWNLQNMYTDVCQLYYNSIKKKKKEKKEIQSVFSILEPMLHCSLH